MRILSVSQYNNVRKYTGPHERISIANYTKTASPRKMDLLYHVHLDAKFFFFIIFFWSKQSVLVVWITNISWQQVYFEANINLSEIVTFLLVYAFRYGRVSLLGRCHLCIIQQKFQKKKQQNKIVVFMIPERKNLKDSCSL